ncbi:hypothetical protein SD70_31045 [Gordoniibacillus kamchatkensis]|uniref:EamA domain-containing protein n=1 Tax=Gordoniibacillus kamchatkensis TaxID=1590651 RepID=A0ABR5A9Q3_9BACL|nr:DMT family transporter [Paenibacillus sp. VKM B-2647]KIL37137.1 hypothetical protein SD70_31045 [Paenibacillus sp. VKM B-2647]
MNKNGSLLGVLLTIASAAGFGVMGIIAKLAYAQGVTVGTLLAYRFAIAAALFWAWIALSRRAAAPLRWRERIALWIMGTLGYAVMASLMFTSFSLMSASLAEMLFYSYPTLVCLLMWAVDKEPLTGRKAEALIGGFAGLLLVLQSPAGLVTASGIACALAAAAVYAVFITYSNRLVKHVSPLVSSAHISSSAAVALAVYAALQGDLHVVRGAPAWGAILGVAVLSTFVAILFFFEGVKRIGSTRASMLSTMEPVVTLACSAALFHERLRPLQWLGIAVVLLSLMAMEVRGTIRRASRKVRGTVKESAI